MPKIPRTNTTLAEAHDVQSVWKTIPDFKMGDVTLNDFIAAMEAADGLTKQHATSGVERTGLKANRDDKLRYLTQLVTRFRSGMRSAYGPDSPLYEQAGGKRSSSRKPPKRSVEAAPKTGTPAAPTTAQGTNGSAAQHA